LDINFIIIKMESSKEAESAQREGEFKAEILQPESKDP
jgi:hypothetical protein